MMWTYIGQIVTFIAFVVILNLLLYKPIRRMMQERKDAMETDLRDAEKKLADAEELRQEAQTATEELAAQRDAVMQQARDQAEAQGKELLKQAEERARDRLERFRRVMEQERELLLDNIADDLRDTIVQVAGAVLSDASGRLADSSLERVETLLGAMSEEDREAARKALAGLDNRVEVRSAGPLDDEQADRLKTTLAGTLGVESVQLDISEDPSLLAGIEVAIGHVNIEAHWRGVIDEALAQHKAAVTPNRNDTNTESTENTENDKNTDSVENAERQ